MLKWLFFLCLNWVAVIRVIVPTSAMSVLVHPALCIKWYQHKKRLPDLLYQGSKVTSKGVYFVLRIRSGLTPFSLCCILPDLNLFITVVTSFHHTYLLPVRRMHALITPQHIGKGCL